MSSENAYNLEKAKILSLGKELKCIPKTEALTTLQEANFLKTLTISQTTDFKLF